MKDLLTRYQAAINKWLGIFGAPFSIDSMGVTYQGSTTPRTEYAIILRKTRVQAGKKSVNGLSFHNALSEGDKRTLALAVFLARVQDGFGGNSAVYIHVRKLGEAESKRTLVFRYFEIGGSEPPKIEWTGQNYVQVSVGHVSQITKQLSKLKEVEIAYSVGREDYARP